MKPSNWLESVNCAVEGVLWAVRSQRHMRYHFVAAVTVLLLALFFRISAQEFILLVVAASLVLFAELFNTALEVLVDLVSPEYHPLARRAKDVAAGAVLVVSAGAVVIGYLAFSQHLFPDGGPTNGGAAPVPGGLSVISALTVIILVVLAKARWETGTPLHGGMPSGHAAVAFSIASSMVLSGVGVVFSLLALAMAAMVSHSRLLLGIHTLREVLAGALLGTGITVAIHLSFG